MKALYYRSLPVLYHAVSAYQLLEVLLHRILVHPNEPAVLVVPDFIKEKYPNIMLIASRRLFDRVGLFPYTQIPHTTEPEITARALNAWEVLFGDTRFSRIYVAGAHFYFSLCLIQKGLPFSMFEDAAGMLTRPRTLFASLLKTYPVQAAIAAKYGLFTGEHPLVQTVICLTRAQAFMPQSVRCENFCVEDALEALSKKQRRKIVSLFVRAPIHTQANAVFLTQQLSALGILSGEEQHTFYRALFASLPENTRLFLKVHPDDKTDYTALLPDAQICTAPFPSELLPYVLTPLPKSLYTAGSTGYHNLMHHFRVYQPKGGVWCPVS